MRAFVLTATLFCATGTAWAVRATVTSQNDFKVGPHPTVIVDSSAGGVELTAGPAGSVKIDIERQGETEDEARKLDVQIKQEGNTIRVHFSHKHTGWHDGASVNFRITAPADAKLDISTGGGGVGARGFSGGIKVDTGGGGIEIDGASGEVALRSGGGSIEVRHVKGSVDVSTGGGSVRVEGALSGKNRVETGGGSIHVAIPAASKLAVDASTGGGSAHNDFGIPSDGERHSGRFRGNIGDGSGGSLELRTGGGSISLAKAG
jgi:putative adhesin